MNKDIDLEEKLLNSKKFWSSKDFSEVNMDAISYDFNINKGCKIEQIDFSLNTELLKKLNALTEGVDLKQYVIFLVALKSELYKYSENSQSVIGVPVYLGNNDIEDVFNNKILPLKSDIRKEFSVKELIKNVQTELFMMYENEYCNVNEIFKGENLAEDIMQITSVNITMNTIHNNKTIESICNSKDNKITICINKKNNNDIYISLFYNANLYSKVSIEIFEKRFEKLVCEIIANINKNISDLDIFIENEYEDIIYNYNNTYSIYDKKSTIQEIFEKQALEKPNKIAVKYGNAKLTYQELNEKANQLARKLKNDGVKQDTIVALMMKPSLELIIGIIGVLKSGGAYVPIDIKYPKERIEYILNDANVDIVISTEEIIKNINFNAKLIDINKHKFNEDTQNLVVQSKSFNLAYVIYTSGSTGNPKGVMIEHSSVLNYIKFCNKYYQRDGSGDLPLFTSISFDLTVTSVFVPLLSGHKIVIENIDEDINLSSILEGDIDIIKLTPAHLSIINDLKVSYTNVTKMILGGEELSEKLANDINNKFNNKIDIINEYGPTEATVGCIIYKFDNNRLRGKN
ncbi:AMP-binding protein, partial (plasmid) [Clostridium gasigenes]